MPKFLLKLIAASLGVLAVTQSYAVTNWTSWTIPGAYPKAHLTGTPPANDTAPVDGQPDGGGYAISTTGTVNDPNNGGAAVTITLTGEIMKTGTSPNVPFTTSAESPATAYDDATFSSPVGEDMISQTGYTEQADKAHTITFSSSVSGVVMGIWSLGSTSSDSSLLFSEDFEIVDSDGQLTRTVTPQGYRLTGNALGGGLGGGAGLIRFYGSHTSITYTVTDPEYYSGMSIALTDQLSGASGGSTITIDTTAPTLSSSNPADDAQGVAVDSNITLTFSENIVDNSGTITLKKSSDNSTVETFSGFSISGDTITLNPSSNLDIDTDYYIEISNGAVKDATGNLYTGLSGSTSLNFSTNRADPTSNADVVSSVKAMAGMASQFAGISMRSVNRRMAWLNQNKLSNEKSRQGIEFNFTNPYLQHYFNGSSVNFQNLTLVDAMNAIRKYGDNADQIQSDVQDMGIKLAMDQARDKLGAVNLNPTGGTVYGEWSLWTEGTITIGETDATSTTSAQDSNSFAITAGLDRPIGDNALIGAALTYGQDDMDIGTVGSGVDSENYALSVYGNFQPSNMPMMEAIGGVGKMKLDTVRIDGAQTLSGDRDAHILFGSLTVRKETLQYEDFALSPFARLEAAYIDLKDYAETGGNLALAYDDQKIKQAMLFFGTEFVSEHHYAGGKLRPFGKFEYGFDFTADSNADMHYVGDATNYRLVVDRNADQHWLLRIGADYHIKEDLKASISLDHSEAVGSGSADTLRLELNVQL